MPWRLKWYCTFNNKQKALKLEQYLKSGTGKAFAKERLRKVRLHLNSSLYKGFFIGKISYVYAHCPKTIDIIAVIISSKQ